MQGWLIFKHAVAMLWGNKRAVLQIALAPILIATALIVGTIAMFSDLTVISEQMFGADPFAATPVLAPEQFGSFFTGIALFVLLSMVFTMWVIVNWHRFILLSEHPTGWVPPFQRDRVWAYFVQLLKLFGLGILVCIPLSILFGVIAAAGGGVTEIIIFGVVVGAVVTVLFMRWSLILPGAAIAQPLTVGQSFNATAGASIALLVTLVLVSVLQFGLQFAAEFIAEVSPLIGFALNLLFSFAIGMLNASILTTLYGHYVEGRDL